MDPAIAPAEPEIQRGIRPNLFDLRNRHITVNFSASSFSGKPLLQYKDRQREVSASGDEIRQEETEVGTLVTITLEPDADAGALLFTVIIPRAIIFNRAEIPISTQAIYTRSRLPPRLPVSTQLQTYEVIPLKGTAAAVDF
ncbi:hypothetical protein [Hyalangium rubrum]|uniref:Lipoprotein n=1 Tax=Hyalangium rubrum TaxID=3103134 RepID=A0ABU5GZT2_9BACT|nr:hypothetical protein [Hyalangium sp. s54d21]MDY7226047.1 hypothetical protein [Hyalangium sp. s54d21]